MLYRMYSRGCERRGFKTETIDFLDGDEAGNKATLACSKELNEIGVNPKVIRLPDKLDPNEFIKKYGVDKLNDYINNPPQ